MQARKYSQVPTAIQRIVQSPYQHLLPAVHGPCQRNPLAEGTETPLPRRCPRGWRCLFRSWRRHIVEAVSASIALAPWTRTSRARRPARCATLRVRAGTAMPWRCRSLPAPRALRPLIRRVHALRTPAPLAAALNRRPPRPLAMPVHISAPCAALAVSAPAPAHLRTERTQAPPRVALTVRIPLRPRRAGRPPAPLSLLPTATPHRPPRRPRAPRVRRNRAHRVRTLAAPCPTLIPTALPPALSQSLFILPLQNVVRDALLADQIARHLGGERGRKARVEQLLGARRARFVRPVLRARFTFVAVVAPLQTLLAERCGGGFRRAGAWAAEHGVKVIAGEAL